MNTKTHTDIKSFGWLDRFLSPKVKAYMRLARLDRPIGIWLLVLPAWWMILMGTQFWLVGERELQSFVLFGAGAVLMRAAGCVINDLWDRDLDRRVERTAQRPLASGELSVFEAVIFLALLLTGGLVILLQMHKMTILLGLLSLPLIVLYPLMKRWTWWPQLFLGLVFNFGILMGAAEVSEGLLLFYDFLPIIMIYVAAVFWTLGYDTIYAHQDMEDDMAVGIKSTALRLRANSKAWVMGFYALTTLLLFIGVATMGDLGWFVGAMVAFPPAFHLAWQIKNWDPDDAQSSLRIFKSNRDYGLILLFTFAFCTLVREF